MDRSRSSSRRSLTSRTHRSCNAGALWILVSILAFGSSSTLAIPRTHGIPPKDLKYFETSTIWCRDKSKNFPREHLNDNYCDCGDGTDEPGTSACRESKFYCSNIGHRPETLFSSRVNDGICDCCDGSDEYDGQIKCSNTCWEAGKKYRAKAEKKLATFKEGLKLRTKDVDYARHKRKELQDELSTLKKEEKVLKDMVGKLKEQVDAIEKAEEEEMKRKKAEQEKLEKLNASVEDTNAAIEETTTELKLQDELEKPEGFYAKEKEMGKDEQSAEDSVKVETTHSEKPQESYSEETEIGVIEESVEDSVKVEIPHFDKPEESYVEEKETGASEHSLEDVVQSEEHKNMEDLSKEDLGKLVASRWTGKKIENDVHEERGFSNNEDSDNAMEEIEDVDESPMELYETQEAFENKENDADLDNEDDEDEEDDNEKSDGLSENEDSLIPSKSPWWKKLLRAPKTLLKFIGVTKLQFDKSEIEQIRKEFSEMNSKLSNLQQKISDMEHKLKQDFGKDGEFFSFYDQCFEIKLNKYLYKICPYKKATQEENHSTTRLGNWDGFKDDYRTMVFSNGDKCWNGPDRSLRVKLRCGLQNEILSVEEPSRCEYVAELASPAICLESRLQALQQQQQNAQSGQELHEEL